MAVVAAAFGGLLGLISFLTALLMLDYGFLSAFALNMAVANSAFALIMIWAGVTFRSREGRVAWVGN